VIKPEYVRSSENLPTEKCCNFAHCYKCSSKWGGRNRVESQDKSIEPYRACRKQSFSFNFVCESFQIKCVSHKKLTHFFNISARSKNNPQITANDVNTGLVGRVQTCIHENSREKGEMLLVKRPVLVVLIEIDKLVSQVSLVSLVSFVSLVS